MDLRAGTKSLATALAVAAAFLATSPREAGTQQPSLGFCEQGFSFHKFTLDPTGDRVGGYSHDWVYYSCNVPHPLYGGCQC